MCTSRGAEGRGVRGRGGGRPRWGEGDSILFAGHRRFFVLFSMLFSILFSIICNQFLFSIMFSVLFSILFSIKFSIILHILFSILFSVLLSILVSFLCSILFSIPSREGFAPMDSVAVFTGGRKLKEKSTV